MKEKLGGTIDSFSTIIIDEQSFRIVRKSSNF